MLVLNNIYKSFDGVNVLNGIDLHLKRGFIYTLKGGNGSGKTTLLNIISGFIKPTSGKIEFKGKNITDVSPYKLNRFGISRTFQDLRLATQMTVYENLLLALEVKAFAYPTSKQKNKIEEILNNVSLTEKRNELAGEISYGQQKLLTLGCCIANNADLLLIDEPVAGIDKSNFLKIINLISGLKDIGKTILQIEHHTEYIEKISDYILDMEGGKIKC